MLCCATQVRISLLSTLLDEAYSYMHRFLCASALQRKLFTMPFNREVEINPRRTAAMRACLAFCRQVGILAPSLDATPFYALMYYFHFVFLTTNFRVCR